jgi:ATP-binding cassette, subfamily B, bacterial
VVTALVPFERLFEVLDIVPMTEEDPEAVDIPRDPVSIELDGVSFTYPGAEEVSLASLESVAVLESGPRNEVLHDVSFRIEPGQMVALVGPSGAGKTTISSLIPRLYDVTAGSLQLSGIDVRHATMQSIRDVVGVVAQDPYLFHDTLGANLLYARPEATKEEVVIALARLMLKAPDVVVLDEATAHLDSESEAAVQRALRETLSGRTSLVIAHRFSTVREADQLLALDDGRVVERGTHASLLSQNGLYSELYHTQFADQEAEGPESPAA